MSRRRPRVIVLTGPIASGKTSLALALHESYGFKVVRTVDALGRRLGRKGDDRRALQREGARLDRETGGRWIVDEVVRQYPTIDTTIVIDACRFGGQLDALREAYGTAVMHVHLTASSATLEERYESRREVTRLREPASYDLVRRDKTERAVSELQSDADVVIETDRQTLQDVVVRLSSRLGIATALEANVDVLLGGQFGSEGKGNIAAYVSKEYDLLVRSGGPNAGHTVMVGDRKHVQRHLPSGASTSSAHLLLTAGAVIDVPLLLQEIANSHIDVNRLSIDPYALIIDDSDKEREGRLRSSVGSTGSGVGAATARRILDRGESVSFARDEPQLQPYVRPASDVLESAHRGRHQVLVEGTQGSALSLLHGPYPYVTSRDTTASGLLAEAGISPLRVRRIMMVCRTYPIRVQSPAGGTSGPMGLEVSWSDVASRSGLDSEELESAERTTSTGRRRRVAEFSWELLHRSCQLNTPTDIALTFADYIDSSNRSARRFEQLTPATIRFVEEVERVARCPVSLISTRFHARSIIDRRMW